MDKVSPPLVCSVLLVTSHPTPVLPASLGAPPLQHIQLTSTVCTALWVGRQAPTKVKTNHDCTSFSPSGVLAVVRFLLRFPKWISRGGDQTNPSHLWRSRSFALVEGQALQACRVVLKHLYFSLPFSDRRPGRLMPWCPATQLVILWPQN